MEPFTLILPKLSTLFSAFDCAFYWVIAMNASS